MDNDRPLSSTLKLFAEDNAARAKPAPSTAPMQPQGAERWPGHHSRRDRLPPGFWSPPPPQSLPEGGLWPERVALRARTRLWFEQTQAQRLGPEGELPAWFHGFLSRREAEELLQDQPLGCFLVRFSESTIGFVLSYRGRDRCRHFVLDQLPDGRYVILGERSAHAELAQLLQHHATAPLTPYHEFLTAALPCGRDGEPGGRAGGDAARSLLREAPAELPSVELSSPECLEPPRAEGGSARQAPGVPPSLPARSGSRGSCSPSSSSAAPEPPPGGGHGEAARPEHKYEQLLRFHVYAEPHQGIARSPPSRCQPEEPVPAEPIPFYAMARRCSPRAGPEENIYSEVALARQDLPARIPAAPQNAFSTLPPKPRPQRRLFRSVSSQGCEKRQLLVAPSTDRGASTEVLPKPALQLDEPVYSQSTRREQQSGAENVYEQLPGEQP